MTAKEIQSNFIKNYLKLTLKKYAYKTSGKTWWKDKGEFYTLINLQNYSWNGKEQVDFCFNIGIVVKKIALLIKILLFMILQFTLGKGFIYPIKERNIYIEISRVIL